jgi:hypothetical protein
MNRVLFLIIPFALYALTSSQAQRGTTDAPDPCALVSKAEVEKAFGPLKEDAKTTTGLQNEKVCNYTNMSGNYLMLHLYASDKWELQKGINSEKNPKPLAGLGEEGFYVVKSGNKEMFIRNGPWILELDGSTDTEVLKAIAAIALPRVK